MITSGNESHIHLRNLAKLRERFPNVPTSASDRSGRFIVSPSEQGIPTLRVTHPDGGSHWIHSRFDPLSEAERLAAQWADGERLYVILGFGLGYHVESLLKNIPKGSQVLVGEPLRELFDLALETVPLSAILEYPDLHLAIGNELNLVSELRRLDLTSCALEPRICVHPALARTLPDQYQRWQEVLRGTLSSVLSNVATLIKWDLTWGQNTMENLPRAMRARPVRRLFGLFQDVPAIVVSAGPSLDENVALLKQAKGRGLILAVDTALKPLMANRVQPDAVISYDGAPANFQHFQGVSYSQFPLIYDPMVHPSIPAGHEGSQWVMTTSSNPFMLWLEWAFGPVGDVMSGGSISTVALDLAVKFGCNPIILVGQDLAYRGGRTHARGTVNENVRVDISQPRGDGRYLQVPGVSGEPVCTSRSLYGFLTWLERFIAAAPPHLRFIDATEGGAMIRGTAVMSLQEAIERHGRRGIVSGHVFQESQRYPEWSPGQDRVVSYLRYTLESLASIREVASDAQRKANDAQQLVKLGRAHQNRFQRLMKQLDEADQALRGSDPAVRGLLDLAAYRTRLKVLRAPHKGSKVPEGPAEILQRSKILYEGIDAAAERTDELIRVGLENLSRHLAMAHAPERVKQQETNSVAASPSAGAIVHYGWHWGWGNAGDTALFQEVRDVFDHTLGRQHWSLRNLSEELTRHLVERYNVEARAIVVGGGGLLLRDTNANTNSGWQWNCAPDALRRIRVPLIVFAIGYNRFRSQEDFEPVFKEHLALAIEKSAFFGLRNLGSVRAVQEYVGDGLAERIRLQPCPTTLISRVHVKYAERHPDSDQMRLVVNVAVDRSGLRFGERQHEILESVAKALKVFADRKWRIQVALHLRGDALFVPYLRDADVPHEIVPLVSESPEAIREFYWKAPLSLGMRGHSQLIPFGLGNPVLSLVSHNKLQWFLEDIGHPEWGIDIRQKSLQDAIVGSVEDAAEHLDDLRRECAVAQDALWERTLENMRYIGEVLG